MAKRNSTSKSRRGRKLSRAEGERMSRGRKGPLTGDDNSRTKTSDSTVEIERTRLMKAETVLGCIAFALNYSTWRAENGTEYANAVQVARELVQQSINRLDRVNVGRRSDVGNESQRQT